MSVHMCTVIFRVLCIMNVLVAAKHAANAVAQKCKVLSRPSKFILICRWKCQSKGHYIINRVWTCPFLRQVRLKHEEVPNWLGNLCLSISPLQVDVMPLLKKSKNCDPELFLSVISKSTCLINCQALGCCVYLL